MLEIMTNTRDKDWSFSFVNYDPPTSHPSIGSECTHKISLGAVTFQFQGSPPVIYLLPFEPRAPVTVSCLQAELPLCTVSGPVQPLFVVQPPNSLPRPHSHVFDYKFQYTSPIPVYAPSVSNMTFLSFPSISNRYTLPPKSVI